MKNIIVALDVSTKTDLKNILSKLDPSLCRVKIGIELFTNLGSESVLIAQQQGFDVFLDLKFHDIPNTVSHSIKAACDLGVWMVNAHALGGRRMLDAARNAVDMSSHKPILIAVTVLTHMNEEDLMPIGINISLNEQVLNLATIAKNSGYDGVVCSAHESLHIKNKLSLKTITPGIRPINSSRDDQSRIVTPQQAVVCGVDYMVIGRPITKADDPRASLLNIIDSLQKKTNI